jgi:hypothetical protein
MQRKLRFKLSALLVAAMLLAAYTGTTSAQQSETATNRVAAKKGGGIQPAGSSAPVTGSGTADKVAKWIGGDSAITEDKFGKVGIGTTLPTSELTVDGTIETTAGGVKFPDGTVQTTAALSGLAAVTHDGTLTGSGTPASPLSVASPAMQPFQTSFAVNFPPNLGEAVATVSVPPGKRLIIKFVSVRISVAVGATATVYFLTTGGGANSASDHLALTQQGQVSPISSEFTASQPVEVFADPGTAIKFVFLRFPDASPIGDAVGSIHGYLVDAP